MSNKMKLILIAAGGAMLITALVVVVVLTSERSGGLADEPNVPEEHRSRIITIESAEGEFKTAVNKYDGYRITVPSDWLVENTAGPRLGLNIYSDPESIDEEWIGGALLNVRAVDKLEAVEGFVPEDTEFREIKLRGQTAYKASYGVFDFYVDENANIVYTPIDQSGTIAYIFRGDKKYYFVRCTVISDEDYAKLLSVCEGQALTLEAIN